MATRKTIADLTERTTADFDGTELIEVLPTSTGVSQKVDVGTAATKDSGTASDEVPTNADLTDETPAQSDIGKGTLLFIPDTLRASVEAASGGRATVLYDDLGYPSYMVRVPKFLREDIHADFGTGVHPAFIVNGTEKSEIWIGMHLASVYNNRALSLPGVKPGVSLDWDEANTYCTNKGAGWHLMTNWEWAAVALWVLRQVADGTLAHQPRGNTDDGRAHDAHSETGTTDGTIGGSSGDETLTGSGPDAWRHNLAAYGIADLVGNVWEWVGGLKIVDGAIKMPSDNYYSQDDASWADQDAAITDSDPWSADGVTLGGSADGELLKAALLDPATVSDQANGKLIVDDLDERVPRRGGRWVDGSGAGLAALWLANTRSYSLSGIGFRPAFVA